jgi:transcriptional regulator with XRE-family HTH domain
MFYERLKKLCFESGVSLSKMAVDLKMSTNTVTGWKRGASPRPAQVKKIAEYFKIHTDELLLETSAAQLAPADLPEGVANLMEIIKSQQDTILNLSESLKTLCAPASR